MKHISKLSHATALVAALGAASLTSLSAHAADTPNVGTLNLKASVSKATCALVIGDKADSPGAVAACGSMMPSLACGRWCRQLLAALQQLHSARVFLRLW